MSRLLRNRSAGAIFLCYHSVAASGPKYLTVSRELFERQLDELERRGFRTGGLSELSEVAAGRRSAPTAFLTFDDGFLDNRETVMPILRARRHSAFIFVLPPLVDTAAALAWPEVLEDAGRYPETMRSVDWEMLGEMREAGFEVGSHGLTHAHFRELGGDALRDELLDSRRRITERLGSCETIAYPFGDWSREVAAATAECGYRFAFTLPAKVGQRRATPLSIPRINIDYRDERSRFKAKVSSAGRRLYLSEVLGGARVRVRALRGSD